MRTVVALTTLLLFSQLVVRAQPPSWDGQVINTDLEGPINVVIEDIDGDGDMDVLGSGWFSDTIMWSEQTEDGWESHIIAEYVNGNRGIYPCDLDFDGDMDVVGTSFIRDEIAWWEQTPEGWDKHVVADNVDGPANVLAIDMDNDSDFDIVATAFHANEVAWWEQTDQQWVKHVIGTDFNGANGVDAADFDSDGDLDILACAQGDNDVSWWENTGSSWVEHLIVDDLYSTRCVVADDLDNDGDVDIIATGVTSDAILYWENRSGEFVRYLVTNRFNGARQVSIADVDNDGDKDIVASALWASEVSWFENRVTDSWTKHLISDGLLLAKGVDTADIDGDGDIDVVAASYHNDRIMLSLQGTEHNPDKVVVRVAPTTYPAIIQPDSTLYLNIDIVFRGLHLQNYFMWAEVMTPDGEIQWPVIYDQRFILYNKWIPVRDLQQHIPHYAQPGEYDWKIYVGENTSHAINMSSFRFTVTDEEITGGGFSYSDWSVSGFDLMGTEDIDLVEHLDTSVPEDSDFVGSAYPNPFNEQITVPVHLNQQRNVRVIITNTLGQQVAVLHSGTMSVGMHELSWNASHMTSGLYFVQVDLDGQQMSTQKLLLVR